MQIQFTTILLLTMFNMSQFVVNPQRFDPYKDFKFRVKWDGRVIAGVSKMSALKRTTDVVTSREGGDPNIVRKSPGITKCHAITLERGVTHDTAFEDWADKVWRYGAGGVSLKDFRKDIMIEFLNEAGQAVKRYFVYRCWVSGYTALPNLDANGNATAIERITIEFEGWIRDLDTTEPIERQRP